MMCVYTILILNITYVVFNIVRSELHAVLVWILSKAEPEARSCGAGILEGKETGERKQIE